VLSKIPCSILGYKSQVYMGEIVPAMLARMKHGGNFSPVFVWSGKGCEVIQFEDGIPVAWEKPLQKVFWRYPDFSHSNTVMVDHNITRLGGIPSANLIIPTPFYVAELQKLGDDKAFLKGSLWPHLQGFYASQDINHFRQEYPDNVVMRTEEVLKLCDTGTPPNSTEHVEGEGACGT
jgi:hypothetical protein